MPSPLQNFIHRLANQSNFSLFISKALTSCYVAWLKPTPTSRLRFSLDIGDRTLPTHPFNTSSQLTSQLILSTHPLDPPLPVHPSFQPTNSQTPTPSRYSAGGWLARAMLGDGQWLGTVHPPTHPHPPALSPTHPPIPPLDLSITRPLTCTRICCLITNNTCTTPTHT